MKGGLLDFPQINEEECESDHFSEGKSDCESEGNDLSKDKYKALSGKIMKVIDGFNKVIGQDTKNIYVRKNVLVNYHIKKKKKPNKTKEKRKRSTDEMKMVPSLKYKMLTRNLSENKIEMQEESFLKSNKILL